VTFEQVDKGLVAKEGELKGFEIAGKDQVWHPAAGRIEGQTIVLKSAAVNEPVAVRYAWDDNPVCNLYNAAGLPASPFRLPN
jgi:sialate O-acetylesterase